MRPFLSAFFGVIAAVLALTVIGGGALILLVAGAGLTWFAMSGDVEVVESPRTVAHAPARRARSGELQIHSFATVQFQVDGEVMSMDNQSGNYRVRLGEGEHLIQVYNAWMKEVARETVRIKPGKRLMLKYVNKQKVFSKVGEVRVASAGPTGVVPAAAPAPRPAPVPAPVPVMAARVPDEPVRKNTFGGLGGVLKGIKGENTSRRKSTSSSTRYGEVNTHAPGRSETHGYVDHQDDEVETKRRRVFGL